MFNFVVEQDKAWDYALNVVNKKPFQKYRNSNIYMHMCFRALKSSQHSLCSLLIVDTPGFQNPRLAKRDCGATFEDLCHNYTQERLQTLFYQRTFVQELERYKEVRGMMCCACTLALYISLLSYLSASFSQIYQLRWCVCACVFTHQIHFPSYLSQALTRQSSSCVRPSH